MLTARQLDELEEAIRNYHYNKHAGALERCEDEKCSEAKESLEWLRGYILSGQ